MNECDAGEDSEEEEFRQSEGVIDLEDYLEDLKEQDEEWTKSTPFSVCEIPKMEHAIVDVFIFHHRPLTKFFS